MRLLILENLLLDYADYELDIVDPEIGSPVAVLGSEWCATHGANLDWIVLTKQLTNERRSYCSCKSVRSTL